MDPAITASWECPGYSPPWHSYIHTYICMHMCIQNVLRTYIHTYTHVRMYAYNICTCMYFINVRTFLCMLHCYVCCTDSDVIISLGVLACAVKHCALSLLFVMVMAD